MSMKIKTFIIPPYTIKQEILQVDPFSKIENSITQWVCDTKEDGIRKSLITLGWTPPAHSESDPEIIEAGLVEAERKTKLLRVSDQIVYLGTLDVLTEKGRIELNELCAIYKELRRNES